MFFPPLLYVQFTRAKRLRCSIPNRLQHRWIGPLAGLSKNKPWKWKLVLSSTTPFFISLLQWSAVLWLNLMLKKIPNIIQQWRWCFTLWTELHQQSRQPTVNLVFKIFFNNDYSNWSFFYERRTKKVFQNISDAWNKDWATYRELECSLQMSYHL